MKRLNRITLTLILSGACIRGMRITVGTIVRLAASGHSVSNILELYPYLEEQNIRRLCVTPSGELKNWDTRFSQHENTY